MQTKHQCTQTDILRTLKFKETHIKPTLSSSSEGVGDSGGSVAGVDGLLQLLGGGKVGSKGNGKQKENERKAHNMKNKMTFIHVRLACQTVLGQFFKITVISGCCVLRLHFACYDPLFQPSDKFGL